MNPMIRTIDCANGDKITDREMTATEHTKYLAEQTANTLAATAIKMAEATAATTLASAKTKLAALGLSAAEIKALLG